MKNKKLLMALLALTCVSATGLAACFGSGVQSGSESNSDVEISSDGLSDSIESSSDEDSSVENSSDENSSDEGGNGGEQQPDEYENHVKIIDKTLAIDGEWTTETPNALSEASLKIDLAWTEVDFTNQSLLPYTSVVFWMKAVQDDTVADSGWISIADRLGEYNEKKAQLYGVKDENWHKIELKRETVSGEISYRLYVDDVKVEQLDDGKAVDARAKNKLSDLYMTLAGTYYVTETFGVVDPNYVESALIYEIVLDSPISDTVDSYELEDLPCAESIQVNVYGAGSWRQRQLVSLELAPYSYVKFYIKSADSWTELLTEDKTQIAAKEASDTWHEIVLEKNGKEYSILVDGSYLDAKVSKNLNELMTSLGENAVYYMSEVFAVADDEYVPPVYTSILAQSPYGEAAETAAEMEKPAEYISKIYEVTGEDYAAHTFNSLNLLPYEKAVFYVKVADATSGNNWLQLTDGGTNAYLQANDGNWHSVIFAKEKGYVTVSVDNTKKATLTDLSQLFIAMTPNATYYVTEICGYADENYVAANLTVGSGNGYEVSVENALVKEGVASLQQGATVVFSVNVNGQYDASAMVVKANDTVLEAVDGKYSFLLEGDSTISVEGVIEREGPKDLGDYVIAQNCIFTESDATTTIDKLETNMSELSTVITKTWSATPNISFNVNKADKYTELKFYILGQQAGQWFQVRENGSSSDLIAFEGDNETFHEVKFVKENGAWTLHYDNAWKGAGIADINAMDVYMNGTYYISELFGIVDENYVETETTKYAFTATNGAGYTISVNDITLTDGVAEVEEGTSVSFTVSVADGYDGSAMVVKANGSALTAADGVYTVTVNAATTITVEGVAQKEAWINVMSNFISKDPTSTTTDDLADGAVLTNVIAGGWKQGGTPILDCELIPYKEVKFFFKADGSAYFEVLNAADGSFLIGNNGTEWTEVTLKKEDSSWRLYNGTNWVDFTCTNLAEMHVQLGENGTFYVSNLMGIADPDYVAPVFEKISDQPFDLTNGTASEDIAEGFTTSTAFTTSWNKYNFKPFNLEPYAEVKFAVKSAGWYGMMNGDNVINETDGGGEWLVIRLKKAASGWDLYYGGTKQGNYDVSDLADFYFRFGANTYLVSELQGIADPDYVVPVFEKISDQPFTLTGTASEDIAEGFTTSTAITTTWNKYNFNPLKLGPYKEVKFAVKSAGFYGMMPNASTVVNETNGGGEWLVIRLKKAASGWDLYYGADKQGNYDVSDLADFYFRFGENTYLVSELQGIADPDYVAPPVVFVLENPVAKDATSSTTDDLAPGADTTNIIAGGWVAGGTALKDFDVTAYSEVKFYFKADGSAWFEVLDATGATQLAANNGTDWQEVRLTKEGDSWRLYINNDWKNYTCTNLSDLHVQLGDNGTFSISNLIVKD